MRPQDTRQEKGFTAEKVAAPKPVWRLEDSIWAPRRYQCDSRHFYEREEVMRKMFDLDWRLARSGGKLDNWITQKATMYEDAEEAMAAVTDVMWRYHKLLYSVFDFYAAIGASSNIFVIQVNAYLSLLSTVDVMVEDSALCSAGALGSLFKEANVRGASDGSDYNHSQALNRQEFLWCVVRIAVQYKMALDPTVDARTPNPRLDVPVALVDFCERIEAKVCGEAQQSSDNFRRECCYNEPVDIVLRRHEASLRTLFRLYSSIDNSLADKCKSGKLMGYSEFQTFTKDMGLIDGQFTAWDASLCFVWSRMRVVDENAASSRARLEQLQFIDFLEALVRTADMKVMPSAKEAAAVGCTDTAEYTLLLLANNLFDDFLVRMRDSPQEQPPMDESLESLLLLIVRKISGVLVGPLTKERLSVSTKESLRFHNKGGDVDFETLRMQAADQVKEVARFNATRSDDPRPGSAVSVTGRPGSSTTDRSSRGSRPGSGAYDL